MNDRRAHHDHAAILAVCAGDKSLREAACVLSGVTRADSAHDAIEMLRVLRFDLLVVGSELPDMPLPLFVRRIKSAWPWMKWAMIAPEMTAEDEIAARSLGVSCMIEGSDSDWRELAAMARTIHTRDLAALTRRPYELSGKDLFRAGANETAWQNRDSR